ncbi:MAG: polysaccharide biosynthesis C-terminal domain-containing protein [Verrucomicrobiota bacterium]
MSFKRQLYGSLLARILGVPIALSISVITARYLGPELRGEFAKIMTTAVIFTILKDLFSGGSQILLKDSFDGLRWLTYQAFLAPLAGVLFFCLLCLSLGSALDFMLPKGVGLVAVVLCSILIYLIGVEEALTRLVTGCQKVNYVNAVRLVLSLFRLVCLFACFYVTAANYVLVVSILVAKSLFFVAAMMFSLTRTLSWKEGSNVRKLDGWGKRSLLLGAKTVGRSIGVILILKSDVWMMAALSTVEQVGIYHVAVGLCALVMTFSNTVANVARTRAIVESENYERTLMLVKFVVLAGMLAWPAVWIGAPILVSVLYGASYMESADIFRVLWGAVVFWSSANIISNVLMVERNAPVWIAICMFAGLFVNLVCNYFFIPQWGGLGAAWASMAAYVVVFVWNICVFFRTYPIRMSSVFSFNLRYFQNV